LKIMHHNIKTLVWICLVSLLFTGNTKAQTAEERVTAVIQKGLACLKLQDRPDALSQCTDATAEALSRLRPDERFAAGMALFANYPCRALGDHKAKFVEQCYRAAVEVEDFFPAMLSLFNMAVCYWNDNNFAGAWDYFETFSQVMSAFLTVSPDDSEADIIQTTIRFRDMARRYVRYMENTFWASKHRHLCGNDQGCRNLGWNMMQQVKARMFQVNMIQGILQHNPDSRLTELLKKRRRLVVFREQARLGIGADAGQAKTMMAQADREIREIEKAGYALSPALDEYENLQTAPLGDTLQSLKENEVLIEYFMTDPKRYVIGWKLEKGKPVKLLRLKIDTDALEAQIDDIRRKIIMEKADYQSLVPSLRALREKLLDPFKIPKGKRLILAVDGKLAGLPFGILPSRNHLLMDDHGITYVPSGSLFHILRRRPRPSNFSVAYAGFSRNGFGPQNHTTLLAKPAYRKGRGVIFESATPGLARHLQTDEEIHRASALFQGSSPLVQVRASESGIYAHKERIANARYLHLATHSVFRNGRFSLWFHGGDGEDGFLSGEEITARLRTSAEMVILSACDTARISAEPMPPEESFSGLTRSFFAAGASRLLVSQWVVSDNAAVELVPRFLKSMQNGYSPETALKKAMHAIRKQRPQPVYWAGYILAGD